MYAEQLDPRSRPSWYPILGDQTPGIDQPYRSTISHKSHCWRAAPKHCFRAWWRHCRHWPAGSRNEQHHLRGCFWSITTLHLRTEPPADARPGATSPHRRPRKGDILRFCSNTICIPSLIAIPHNPKHDALPCVYPSPRQFPSESKI